MRPHPCFITDLLFFIKLYRQQSELALAYLTKSFAVARCTRTNSGKSVVQIVVLFNSFATSPYPCPSQCDFFLISLIN